MFERQLARLVGMISFFWEMYSKNREAFGVLRTKVDKIFTQVKTFNVIEFTVEYSFFCASKSNESFL